MFWRLRGQQFGANLRLRKRVENGSNNAARIDGRDFGIDPATWDAKKMPQNRKD